MIKMLDKIKEYLDNWENIEWRNGILFTLVILFLVITVIFKVGNFRVDIDKGDYPLFENKTEPLGEIIGFSEKINAYEIFTGNYNSGCMKDVEIKSMSPSGARWTGTYCRNQLIPLYDWTLEVIEVYPDQDKAVVKKIKHYAIPYWQILLFFVIVALFFKLLIFITYKITKHTKTKANKK